MLDSQNLRVIAPNQTWDSNYIKVKQALIVLNKELEDKKVLKDEDPTFPPFFVSTLGPSLLGCFTHPKEKIRELSLSLCLKIMTSKAGTSCVGYDEFGERFSKEVMERAFQSAQPKPFEETAEEIRLLLLKLMTSLIVKAPSTTAFESCMIPLKRALTDNFPEVKRECCLLIAKLAKDEDGGKVLRGHGEGLIKGLLGNLNHQHSKTRQMTVKAIGIVLSADGGMEGGEKLMIESVLPGLKRLGFDGIPSVRKALVTCCVKVLGVVFEGGVGGGGGGEGEDMDVVVDAEAAMQVDEGVNGEGYMSYEPFVPALLSHVMGMMCDDVVDVKELALQEMSGLAEVYFKAAGESVFKFGQGDAGALISMYYGKLLRLLIDDATHWTQGQREKSLKTLKVLVEYGGGEREDGKNIVLGDLEILLSCLAGSVRDDEEEIRDGAEAVAKCLGFKLEGSTAAVDILLPRMDGSVSGMNTAEKLTGHLVVLASVLEGGPAEVAKGEAGKIAKALASPAILESAEREVLESLLLACQVFVEKARELEGEAVEKLIQCCVFLMGADINFDLREDTEELLEDLSGGNVPGLLEKCFVKLVQMLKGEDEAPVWTSAKNPKLRAFDALMRIAGETGGKYFGSVIEIFESHMDVENEPESRLLMMALLESVLSKKETAEYIKKGGFGGKLVKDVVAPNIVWKAGGVASSIRKVAIAALFTLLKKEVLETEVLFKSAPQLLPILKTNLGDYDASSRQLCCLSLGILFATLPGALGNEAVHQLYPDLLKCLDDSSDDVRFAACGSLKVFLKSAPPQHFKGTLIDYMCDQLLIHLDDPDPVIQAAVYDILVVAVEVDGGVVKKKATAVRGSHRDVRWCDKLLHLCG